MGDGGREIERCGIWGKENGKWGMWKGERLTSGVELNIWDIFRIRIHNGSRDVYEACEPKHKHIIYSCLRYITVFAGREKLSVVLGCSNMMEQFAPTPFHAGA